MQWFKYDDPRRGSRVQRYKRECDPEGLSQPNLDLYVPYGELGTVVEEGGDWQFDHYRPAYMTVRWDSGKLERIDYVSDEGWTVDICDVTPKLFVNVYLWDKGYGGPEEGGWWFDTYDPVDDHCHQHETELAAQKGLEDELAWAQAENAERYPPDSAISEGHYVVRLEAWPAKLIPQERPHYC